MTKAIRNPNYVVPFVLLLILVGCGGLFSYTYFRFEQGENLPRVDWLPEGAANVSFVKSYNFTAYEFYIDESGYKNWTDYPVTEVEDPFKIYRYSLYKPGNRLYEGDVNRPDYPLATIRNGLYYEVRHGNSGGRIATAYDREKGRAFYQSNPR